MDSDSKLIIILSSIVVVLGIVFIFRITVFKNVQISSPKVSQNISSTTNDENNLTSNNLVVDNKSNSYTNDNSQKNKQSKVLKQNETPKIEYDEISSFLISLIFSILIILALYYCFKNHGFSAGLAFNVICMIIQAFLNGSFQFYVIIRAFIISLIETLIAYSIYKKSTSFFNFLLRIFLFSLAIVGALFAMIAIGMFAMSH